MARSYVAPYHILACGVRGHNMCQYRVQETCVRVRHPMQIPASVRSIAWCSFVHQGDRSSSSIVVFGDGRPRWRQQTHTVTCRFRLIPSRSSHLIERLARLKRPFSPSN